MTIGEYVRSWSLAIAKLWNPEAAYENLLTSTKNLRIGLGKLAQAPYRPVLNDTDKQGFLLLRYLGLGGSIVALNQMDTTKNMVGSENRLITDELPILIPKDCRKNASLADETDIRLSRPLPIDSPFPQAPLSKSDHHDLGMLYCGIIWATIGAVLFIWAIGMRCVPPSSQDQSRFFNSESREPGNKDGIVRIMNSFAATCRHYLLSEAPLRSIFSRTTRLQVLILLVLTGYLTIFTFVGIEYNKWVTPVKNMPEVYNTRTSLGPWSDRVGVLAYALTPLSVMLSSRESLLSVLTGIPYQSFNFLHRWLGYIIFVQSALHTIGWCIIEMTLYQPQPSVGLEWIKQQYMIWGVIAMLFITLLFILSTPWAIRRTGYEFFRKCHYVLAMLYIGACWGHWAKLNCYLIPSLVIWFLDRSARLARTALLHYNYLSDGSMGFTAANAAITHFPDTANSDVVRLDFVHPLDAWEIGQHFYLCFPELSIWQSHPLTPCSIPGTKAEGSIHSYIMRAKKGATRALAELAAAKTNALVQDKSLADRTPITTPVILNGNYGQSITKGLSSSTNILCIAGGTGVTFVLPVMLIVIEQPAIPDRKIELIWAVRRDVDIEWARQELDRLHLARSSHNLNIRIFVTRETRVRDEGTRQGEVLDKKLGDDRIEECSASSASPERVSDEKASSQATSFSVKHWELDTELHRPDLSAVVKDFVDSTIRGQSTIHASGPGEMITVLRQVVAGCNSGTRVWKGNQRFDVSLICDDRLEW
ncbi:hypothetical protein H2200_012946 [Cladophialophora chaetospira]|uniref:FAD-binding FR-type domain-containing protein n=1 Tax=Cladophialophora chaetospira TaxID=386627 RepID=A0AA39CBL3_9EURO|nr:hypothetical protein H2200_012946 [Cladophialophora chaetospira]